MSKVRPLVLLPADLESDKIGGIQSFVKGFIKFAPSDFSVECVSVSADARRRPVGRWVDSEIEGRQVRTFAVTAHRESHRRSLVPIALTYALGLKRWRRRINTSGRVLQFHRAGAPLVFLRDRAPKIQVVHLNVADIDRGVGESRWQWLPGVYHRVEDLSVDGMDRIFVVNTDGVAFYRQRHPQLASRIEFLPTWVDETIFRLPKPGERHAAAAEMRTMLGITGNAPVVLFVGRLEAQKDPILLVDAFSRLQRRDAHLVIVGDGGLRADVVRRVEQASVADRVHVLGFRSRPQIARLMAGSTVLVLVSAFEGMPITVIEALATGLPVVSTNVGEVPRLVTHQRTGWVAADRSAEEIARGLGWVLSQPPRVFTSAAIVSASPYTAQRVLGPFYEAHRQVSANSRIS